MFDNCRRNEALKNCKCVTVESLSEIRSIKICQNLKVVLCLSILLITFPSDNPSICAFGLVWMVLNFFSKLRSKFSTVGQQICCLPVFVRLTAPSSRQSTFVRAVFHELLSCDLFEVYACFRLDTMLSPELRWTELQIGNCIWVLGMILIFSKTEFFSIRILSLILYWGICYSC